jgi:hypothetical protein
VVDLVLDWYKICLGQVAYLALPLGVISTSVHAADSTSWLVPWSLCLVACCGMQHEVQQSVWGSCVQVVIGW